MATIAENATRILDYLVSRHGEDLEAATVAEAVHLEPRDVNDAISVLVDNGYAEWVQWLGTHPFAFGTVSSTPRGKFEHERLAALKEPVPANPAPGSPVAVAAAVVARAPAPVGSPYGFQDEDWEIVSERKEAQDILYVVLGHQFASDHFVTDQLRMNVRQCFEQAVTEYNASPRAIQAHLEFTALGAGYGEHLFNDIARDIISADVAIFDTSDLNPNVMLEMGVALTWGVRVLAIKKEGCPKPPSDVSGQTWADYRDSCATFVDPDHMRKLVRMVDRAVRKKARPT
jgi:hypothetical protein